jgi:hypothetical protein
MCYVVAIKGAKTMLKNTFFCTFALSNLFMIQNMIVLRIINS